MTLASHLGGGNAVTIHDPKIANAVNDGGAARDLIFGVHAEDVIVSHQLIPNAFQAEVYSAEPLGAETIVELTLGTDTSGAHTILKACTAPNFEAEIGQHLYVTFVPERMHFFDKKSGNALF